MTVSYNLNFPAVELSSFRADGVVFVAFEKYMFHVRLGVYN